MAKSTSSQTFFCFIPEGWENHRKITYPYYSGLEGHGLGGLKLKTQRNTHAATHDVHCRDYQRAWLVAQLGAFVSDDSDLPIFVLLDGLGIQHGARV